jgi:hypothetical protein
MRTDRFIRPMTLIGPLGRETVDCVVDTSMLFAIIPAPALKRLGVKPDRFLRDGSGKRRRRGLAQVRAELGGHEGHAMCVFGDADESPRMGRHTLDCFLLDVDPEGQRLVPKEFRLIEHVL